MPSRQPLPGLMPARGERVRVVTEFVRLDRDTRAEVTALAFVAGDPVQDAELNWHIPTVGHGNIPAGLVKRIA